MAGTTGHAEALAEQDERALLESAPERSRAVRDVEDLGFRCASATGIYGVPRKLDTV